MDEIDKKILNIIQTKFPVAHAPYEVIGKKLGISEDEAFERVKALKKGGIIRRIGASFDSRGLGWTSTLCAMNVPPEKIEDVANIISKYSGVTHNYERDHKYNLWFTLIAPDEATIDRTLREIEEKSGYGPVRNMPMIKKFKIKVDFNFKEKDKEEAPK